MAPILQSLGRTVIAGLVILILLVLIASNVSGAGPVMGHAWGAFVMRWLHVVSGVVWIGRRGVHVCGLAGLRKGGGGGGGSQGSGGVAGVRK